MFSLRITYTGLRPHTLFSSARARKTVRLFPIHLAITTSDLVCHAGTSCDLARVRGIERRKALEISQQHEHLSRRSKFYTWVFSQRVTLFAHEVLIPSNLIQFINVESSISARTINANSKQSGKLPQIRRQPYVVKTHALMCCASPPVARLH